MAASLILSRTRRRNPEAAPRVIIRLVAEEHTRRFRRLPKMRKAFDMSGITMPVRRGRHSGPMTKTELYYWHMANGTLWMFFDMFAPGG